DIEGVEDLRVIGIARQLDDDLVALLDDARLRDALLVDAVSDRRHRVRQRALLEVVGERGRDAVAQRVLFAVAAVALGQVARPERLVDLLFYRVGCRLWTWADRDRA